MAEQWRVDNNGTGETVSIFAGDRLLSDIYDEQTALRIVRDHNTELALERRYANAKAEGERAWQRIAENTAAEHDAALAGLKAAHEQIATLQAALAAARLLAVERQEEPFTENDLAILYRLIDQYTEAAYADLPKDHASHAVRQDLREKVTKHLIAAREAARAAQAQPAGGEVGGQVYSPEYDHEVIFEGTITLKDEPMICWSCGRPRDANHTDCV